MNGVELAQLRDIAIEYLPAAQQARDNFKQRGSVRYLRPADYARDLVTTAIKIRCDVTLPAVERAAADLLDAVAMWQCYDPNDPELVDIDPTEQRAYSMRTIAEAAKTLATITGRDMAHLMPADAPAAKGEGVPDTSPSGEEQTPAADDYDEKLAALFDPLPVEALAKMFMIDVAQWEKWAERADRNGLKAARQGRKKFNPHKAGVWLVRNGTQGWDDAHLYRTLVKNLPARSHDDAHLLTGGID